MKASNLAQNHCHEKQKKYVEYVFRIKLNGDFKIKELQQYILFTLLLDCASLKRAKDQSETRQVKEKKKKKKKKKKRKERSIG